MAIRYLLDTNTVSFHIRQSSDVLKRRLKRTRAEVVGISVITEMELRYGLARNPKLRIAPLVEAFLAGISIAPMTSDVAPHYAAIRAALESKGRPIGPLDLMIAAHAISLGAVLITSNLEEFRRVPGLDSVDWTR
jgi:tRNA(fMet)-specific endonuclease VapC